MILNNKNNKYIKLVNSPLYFCFINMINYIIISFDLLYECHQEGDHLSDLFHHLYPSFDAF